MFKFKGAHSLSITHPPFPINTNMLTHTKAHFQHSQSFYSPNSDCEMTQYFNQLYLIYTPAEDRATCVLLLPWLALSMPTGWL